MSDENQDVELRVLVAQTLENNGVLSKIRAELRASVFLALEEQDGAVKTQLVNKPFNDFVSSVEGPLVLSLIRELLEFFELKYTLSVFDPETRCGKDYHYNGRSQLLQDLKIQNLSNKKEPVLAEVLRLAQGHVTNNHDSVNKVNESQLQEPQSHLVSDLRKLVDETSPQHSVSNHVNSAHSPVSVHHSNSPRTMNGTNSPPRLIEAENMSSNSESNSLSSSDNISYPVDSVEEEKHSTPKSNSKAQDSISPKDSLLGLSKAIDENTTKQDAAKPPSSTGTFPLLGNLPPLLNIGNSKKLEPTQGNELNFLNNAMSGLGLGDSMDNYEEDFNSSISAGSVGEEPAKESESEIEEEIISNHSVPEDLAPDITLSQSSDAGIADYLEDVKSNSNEISSKH